MRKVLTRTAVMAAAVALPLTVAGPASAVIGPIPAPQPQVLGTSVPVPDLTGRGLEVLPEGMQAPGVRVPPAQSPATAPQPTGAEQAQPQRFQRNQQSSTQQPVDRQERARQLQSEEIRTERVRTEVVEYMQAVRTPDTEAAPAEQQSLPAEGPNQLPVAGQPAVTEVPPADAAVDPAASQPAGLLPELDALLEALGMAEAPQPTSPRVLPAPRPAPRTIQ